MYIRKIEYEQFKGRSNYWKINEITWEKINLIVGKNASGKTRTLNVIANLANLISGIKKLEYKSGFYKVEFDNGNQKYEYLLHYENSKIIKEKYTENSKVLLNRKSRGIGKIFAKELDTTISFQCPENELASVARRDEIQHPFFNKIYNWGLLSKIFYFGTKLGRDSYYYSAKGLKKINKINFKDTDNAVVVFLKGIQDYGQKYLELIISDLEKIGYYLDGINVNINKNILIKNLLNSQNHPFALFIKEKNLNFRLSQNELSQGMFRVISLIIQLDYSFLEAKPCTIFVDDIGEGLDYERSSLLINLVIKKIHKSPLQIIMSTNNRFVMNKVPLEFWNVIQRINNECKIYNYRNSKEIFDEFEFTGLANSDFLSSEFYLKGFEKD